MGQFEDSCEKIQVVQLVGDTLDNLHLVLRDPRIRSLSAVVVDVARETSVPQSNL